ncbi:late competence protein ComER [Sporolactobacillus sp. THM7-7]|nr:late competence protein ComER [Sporolactobacillus sp. THM7-7]
MKIGLIGTGNMGSLITAALIKSRPIEPSDLFITNRTKEKAFKLEQKYPGLTVCPTATEVIQRSELVFLCIRPLQFFPLLQSVRHAWLSDQLAVSITSPITPGQLEKMIPCFVARAVPSIVNQALAGNTLVTFGSRMDDRQKEKLKRLLMLFSHPIEISEDNIRTASDLSSCGPAFLSYLLEKMVDGAVKSTSISIQEASELITKMIIGYGKLLEENQFTLSELREKVTVKGGVTGVGVSVLNRELGPVFEHLFEETQKKFIEDHAAVDPPFDAENKEIR